MENDQPSPRGKRQALIDAVSGALLVRADSDDDASRTQLRQFLPWWLGSLPTEELARQDAARLAAAAMAHRELAASRAAGSMNIHVFHDRQVAGSHSIIDIVAADQSWLVDSLRAVLATGDHRIHLLVHPVLTVVRDAAGELIRLGPEGDDANRNAASQATSSTTNEALQARQESFIHIEIDAIAEAEEASLEHSIRLMFERLTIARTDTEAMQARLTGMADAMTDPEHAGFLRWLTARQFSAMGAAILVRDTSTPGSADSTWHIEKPLGIVNPSLPANDAWRVNDLLPADLHAETGDAAPALMVCKAGRIAPIIRAEPLDLVLMPVIDAAGTLLRIDCVVGLFVTGLQNEAVNNIPWMRERVDRVIAASGTDTDSHDGKAIAATLRGLPRDMLMQTRSADLLNMALGIVALHERQQVRLFSSTDPLGRYCNCLIYIPREAYSRELRLTMQRVLVARVDGESVSFDTRFSSASDLARLHFVIKKHPPLRREIDFDAIEMEIRQASITWASRLESLLRDAHDERRAIELANRYRDAFPASYREHYSAEAAIADIGFIESELYQSAPVMHFYRRLQEDSDIVNFKLFAIDAPASLSSVIPVIENMGLRVEKEHPFEIKRTGVHPVWVHEFTVHQTGRTSTDPESTALRMQSAFGEIWRGSAENDGFNRLLLAASLDWRQVVMLRALCKYQLQIGVPFSQSYMIDTLVANADIAALLVQLFEARFVPADNAGYREPAARQQQEEQLIKLIDTALDAVSSLDEDRILRGYRKLIQAIVRTNAWCVDERGRHREQLSFKIESDAVPDLPLPRPWREIFVYSTGVEGIHLRGGAVARGGLRWSDRREDFRTEVLGLMKAQMVKNAVIVPVGSKGGFYVKSELPTEREAMMALVIGAYKTFLRGLLDVTDNLDGDTVVPPPSVTRHDEDDPYLVVAADKGTATFSDHANAVALDYGFWLGDAFASGGSVGYDHKQMGITARGAWESVQRHFRGLGVDTQSQDFTVVGVGDMGGDVFGNGMLLSRHIRLQAAFNHQHIFIDPDPDAARSFTERERLFVLPRSSWADYDTSLISAGGGLYSRHDKEITLSQQARTTLGIDAEKLTPSALIRELLKAPVDLLWNGGIGTYIKAAPQTHGEVADRANDSVRINGGELRCKVVGEGGNLGCTQSGRIEYAAAGGHLYTDAIDNSAGVDCSDHEVNIKILLNAAMANSDLTPDARNALLASMTDEVGTLVLRDNYLQTQCIELVAMDGVHSLTEQAAFMQHLEGIDRLDREVEYLPDVDTIAERLASDKGLYRPEIAVLVSYSKMVLYDALLASTLPDDPALETSLFAYFPTVLVSRYKDEIRQHRLRREIIATVVTNLVVNRLGPTFVFRMQTELNADAAEVAAACLVMTDVFRLDTTWAEIESLDNVVAAAEQYRMQILVRGLLERASHSLLRLRRRESGVAELTAQFQSRIDELIATLPECLANEQLETLQQRISHFTDAGVPDAIATRVSEVVPLSSSLDIVDIARSLDQPVGVAAATYFALGHSLELTWLREQISELQVSSRWHALAKSELRSDLHYQQRHLCAEVSSSFADIAEGDQRITAWAARNEAAIEKYQWLMTDLRASSSVDFAMLSLAVNEVHKLLQADRPLTSAADAE